MADDQPTKKVNAMPEDYQQPGSTSQVPPPAGHHFQDAASSLSLIEASPPGIREILASVINVSSSGRYYEPSCGFCSSRHRDAAEEMIAAFDLGVTNREERVSSFFSSVHEEVSTDVIRNHVTSHMNRGDIELRKVEYVSRLASLTGSQMTNLAQAKLATAAVLECLSGVGSIVPTKGLSPAKAQEMKTAVVTKLVKTWTDLIQIHSKLSGELWDEGKMIAIPSSDFQRVFDDALNGAKTPDERRLIAGLLDGLTKAIQK